MVTCAWNPNAGKAETNRYLGLYDLLTLHLHIVQAREKPVYTHIDTQTDTKGGQLLRNRIIPQVV